MFSRTCVRSSGIGHAATAWRRLTHQDTERYREFVSQSSRLGRRDGLRLVRAIYAGLAGPERSRAFVVVDDVDLSDLDGWDRYFPREFVDATERGERPLGLESSLPSDGSV